MAHYTSKNSAEKLEVLTDEPATVEPRAIFVHIAKTGGTTLDSIFRDHYSPHVSLNHITYKSKPADFLKINNTDIKYVSGHFPAAIANFDNFDIKVTIFRSPLDTLCSVYSFCKTEGHPTVLMDEAVKNGTPFSLFEKYFGSSFALERFLIDSNFSIRTRFQKYMHVPSIEHAIVQLQKFDFILDFNNLDCGIKNIIIELGLFPYSKISRKRAYKYEPNYELATNILSTFDSELFGHASSLFPPIDILIDQKYDLYRESYCQHQGIFLQKDEEKNLNLRGAVGCGWHNVEISDLGDPFRWSESLQPTIEMPIALPGIYEIYLYFMPGNSESFSLSASSLIGEQCFEVTLQNSINVYVYKLRALLESADWISVAFEVELTKRVESNLVTSSIVDLRTLGVTLVNVYVQRLV